jgi:CheY-like chemotaxis protein
MNRILLVEDDLGISKNLSHLLSSEGYAVVLADNQKTALAKLENEHFDLLILDIALPDGNGYVVCTAAKQSSDVPVIFLTASDDELSAFALGFAARVRKVVALEPAGAMVAYLEEQIAHQKIDNIRIIQDTWEEVDLEKQNLKKQFDLVFASMSPGINNWETINKALQCARKYCFISGFAGRRQNNALAELWQSLYGGKPPAWSISMLYYLNLLYTKGFAMDVKIWEENRQHESRPEEAVSILKEELQRYTLEEFPSDEQIRSFIDERMENGIFRHEYQSRMGQVLVKL